MSDGTAATPHHRHLVLGSIVLGLIAAVGGLGLAALVGSQFATGDSAVRSLVLLLSLAIAPVTLLVLLFCPGAAIVVYVLSLWSQEIQGIPGPIPYLTVSKLLVFVAFLGWVQQLLFRPKSCQRIVVPSPVIAFIPFVIWGSIVSLLFAQDRQESVRWLIGMVTLPLMCVMIVNLAQSRRMVGVLLFAFLFSCFLGAGASILEYVTHRGILGGRIGGPMDIVRAGTAAGTANDMSMLLTKGLFVLMVLFLAGTGLLRRLLLGLATLALLYAILVLQTRQAYLAIFAGLVLLLLYAPTSLRPRIVLCTLLTVVLLLAYPTSRDRLMTLLGVRSTTVDYSAARESVSKRVKMLYIGRDMWIDYPLAGVGINNVQYHMPRYGARYAISNANATVVLENTFLQAAAETGTVGILLFCVFIITCVVYLHRTVMQSRAGGSFAIAAGLGIGLLASMLFFFMSTLYEDNVFWVGIALMESLRRPNGTSHVSTGA